MDESGFARTVSESVKVQEKVDQGRIQYESFEDIWDGLTWLLARRGHLLGEKIKEYRIYKPKTPEGTWTVPSVTVLYKVTETEIQIIDIMIAEIEDV